MVRVPGKRIVWAGLALAALGTVTVVGRNAGAGSTAADAARFQGVCEQIHARSRMAACADAFALCTRGDMSKVPSCRANFLAKDYWCDQAVAHWYAARDR